MLEQLRADGAIVLWLDDGTLDFWHHKTNRMRLNHGELTSDKSERKSNLFPLFLGWGRFLGSQGFGQTVLLRLYLFDPIWGYADSPVRLLACLSVDRCQDSTNLPVNT